MWELKWAVLEEMQLKKYDIIKNVKSLKRYFYFDTTHIVERNNRIEPK